MSAFDLEERMVSYASAIIRMVNSLPTTFAAKHLGRQIIRSSTSVALNYGEAQAAESRADFIHKLKLSLKELKESYICLKIIFRQDYLSTEKMDLLLKETDELISIITTSIKTARRNQIKK